MKFSMSAKKTAASEASSSFKAKTSLSFIIFDLVFALQEVCDTDKLPLTVRSHVRRNINRGRDIKSASDLA